MPKGSAELLVAVSREAAFAFLADPRHAREWFTPAGFAVPPEGEPHVGMTWVVAQTAETRHPVPTRMSVYDPPSRFMWETTLGSPTVNWAWEVECLPPDHTDRAVGASGGRPPSPAASVPGETLLRLTIHLRPGIQAPIALLFARSMRRTLARRAEHALERARDTLLAYDSAAQPDMPKGSSPTPNSPRKRRR